MSMNKHTPRMYIWYALAYALQLAGMGFLALLLFILFIVISRPEALKMWEVTIILGVMVSANLLFMVGSYMKRLDSDG